MDLEAGPGRHRPRHAQPSVLAPRLPGRAVTTRLAISAGITLVMAATITGGLVAADAVHHNPPGPKLAAEPVVAGGRHSVAVLPSGSAAVGSPIGPPASSGATRPTATSQHRTDPPDTAPASALAASGIPLTALTAYQDAAAREAIRRPSCRLPWTLLAAIGRVESNHGRFAGAVLHSDGVSTPRIIGIALNGHGTALIWDTDHGRLDGDTVYDHAVGPMQFIPSTWASWGVDANGDGRADPFNIFDAAAAAADYLCAAGRDLATTAGQVAAVLSYNHSSAYVATVLDLERVYASGVGSSVPVLPTSPAPPHITPPHLPPVNPGPPPAIHPSPPSTGSTTPPASPLPAPSRITLSPSPTPSDSPSGSPPTSPPTSPPSSPPDSPTEPPSPDAPTS